MPVFNIYETATGILKRQALLPEGYSIAPGVGESLITGSCEFDTTYVLDGALQSYTALELSERERARNTPGLVWSMPGKAVVDTRTTTQMQDVQWPLIKAAKALTELEGFTWDGSVFDSDYVSQTRILLGVLAASQTPGFSVSWRLKNNTNRTLNAADMTAVGVALFNFLNAINVAATAQYDALYGSTNEAVIQSAQWVPP